MKCAPMVAVILTALFLMASESPAEGWQIELVDPGDDVGKYSSLALDSQDLPHIAYYNSEILEGDLKYAHYDGSSWQTEFVDDSPDTDVGRHTSIVVDSGDFPHIAYQDYDNERLKYAVLTGAEWEVSVADSSLCTGFSASIALDTGDMPYISHGNIADIGWASLNLTYWDGAQWCDEEPWLGGDADGLDNSLALDDDNNVHVSHYEGTLGQFKYAYWDGSEWYSEVITDDGPGRFTSIALDSYGRPHISSHNADNHYLSYAYMDADSTWHVEDVCPGGYYSSLAIDSQDRPRIAHYDPDLHDLVYTYWTGSQWASYTVDSDGDVGAYTSLALDSLEAPHISYYNSNEESLYYAWFEYPEGTEGATGLPVSGISLSRPSPNPTSGSAEITFSAPAGRSLDLSVFDLSGRRVRRLFTGEASGTCRTVMVEGLCPGVYLCRLDSGEQAMVEKLVVH